MRRIVRIEQNGYSLCLRHHPFEQLDMLAGHVRLLHRKSSDVAAGPRKTGRQPCTDRVGGNRHDDGDRRGRLLGRQGGLGAITDNDLGIEPHQFGGKAGQLIGVAVRPAVFDHKVVTRMTQCLHPFPEGAPPCRAGSLRGR